MGSSLGFVSNTSDFRPIKTRFRSGSGCYSLNLATEINSQAHSPKGTPSGLIAAEDFHQRSDLSIALRQIICLRFQVLFHSPHRGTFHLSLTVLVHYRSSSVFSLGKWSSQIPTKLACSVVLRNLKGVSLFSLTGLSPSLVGFSTPFC